MGDKKKKDRKKQEDLRQNSISIERFLSNILGVKVEELLRAHLTHEDLKQILPNLKRASIAQVLDDPCMVATGKVILVTDSTHRCLPYKNDRKNFLGNQINSDFSMVMDPEEWENPDATVQRPHYDDLSELTTYELSEYAKELYELGFIGARERVLKELRTRPDSKQGVRRSKEKALKKEKKFLKKQEDEDENY